MSHEHHHEEGQTKELILLTVSALLFAVALLFPQEGFGGAVAFAIPWLLCGHEVIWEAVQKLLHGELLDEDFLMTIASVGAFCLGEYPEAAAVMLLFQLGEFFEGYAEGRSRRSIAALMELCPETAEIERGGELLTLPPEQVQVGDILTVRPGGRVALDGELLSDSASLDTAALTGESLPRELSKGELVRSGCIVLDRPVRLRVTAPLAESTVSRILALTEEAEEGKSRSERFIRRFARVYTPVVVGAALLLAVGGGLISGAWADWLRRALVFLVVSCPCALVISVPMSFFAGIGAASKRGILIKGSGCMEALATASVAAFDKTGTLTEGRFSVQSIRADGMDEAALLRLAAAAEQFSTHPLARSLVDAAGTLTDLAVSEVTEQAGQGVTALVDGRRIAVGSEKLMAAIGADCPAAQESGTVLHVALNGSYAGCIVLADTVKTGAEGLCDALHRQGIARCVMLSGDRRDTAEAIATALQMDEVRAELSPEDKVTALRELRTQGPTLYVGDGINDAPVLAASDVGIAMGAFGSDAAVEAADVVIMDDDPARLVRAVSVARGTRRIVRQNIVLALAVKLLVLALGALGYAPLWLAVFADVGVCILAVLNALRALRLGRR